MVIPNGGKLQLFLPKLNALWYEYCYDTCVTTRKFILCLRPWNVPCLMSTVIRKQCQMLLSLFGQYDAWRTRPLHIYLCFVWTICLQEFKYYKHKGAATTESSSTIIISSLQSLVTYVLYTNKLSRGRFLFIQLFGNNVDIKRIFAIRSKESSSYAQLSIRCALHHTLLDETHHPWSSLSRTSTSIKYVPNTSSSRSSLHRV